MLFQKINRRAPLFFPLVISVAVCSLFCQSNPLRSEDQPDLLAEFPRRVKKITLANGMRVLMVERPSSPTVCLVMYIRTGGMDDEQGKSGLAHMFEHMLFKGTKTVGTKDYSKEEKVMEELDQAEAELQAELDKKAKKDPERFKILQARVAEVERKHRELIVEEEYWKIYETAGAQDFNAGTGYDYTFYVVSLPVNQIELWLRMESDRIKNPVLREFYQERSVVLEERRLRIESNPEGKLVEGFLAAAYMAHPYGRPIIGWESDISRVTREDAVRFFKKHYDISRLVLGVVGGIKGVVMEADIRKYFESIPSVPLPPPTPISEEPPQEGERRITVEFDAEPMLIMGYHRPNSLHPDHPVFEVMAQILGLGKTSRFYKNLIEKKKIAVSVSPEGGAPADRDPSLFCITGTPRSPHTVQELEKAIGAELEELKKNGPTQFELDTIKNNLEARFIEGLNSNRGLADQLANFEALTGDWRKLLDLIKATQAVTAEDIKRVAREYLIPSNKTVGFLVKKK